MLLKSFYKINIIFVQDPIKMNALYRIKSLLGLVILFPLFITSVSGQIISQYVETNSGTTPKGIEIWNNTANTLDFSINNLVIQKGTNGGTPSDDYTLSSGTLASGDVIVIGTSDMETTTTGNGSSFYEKGFNFNGDDALVVKYGGAITDVFGNPGSDPGSAWTGNGVSTANQTIQLKSGITAGDIDGWTDPSSRFETVSTNPSGAGGLVGFGLAPTGNTTVQFVSTATTVSEGSVNYNLIIEIVNPSASVATSCDVALISGSAADLGNYTTQTLTFPANSSANQTVVVTITDDAVFEGEESFIFQIQNVSGGSSAVVGSNDEFTLTITDNDDPIITSLPYLQDFTDCNHYWTSYSEASNKDWSCSVGNYFTISGYGGDVASNDYIISPKFDLSAYSKATLSFRSSKGWNDVTHPTMEILYTTSITTDTSLTVWTPLSAILPEEDDWWTWYNSGDIDLTSIIGSSFYLAFHYTSSGTGTNQAATWRFDDVNIVASDGDTEVYFGSTQPSADLSSTVDSVQEAQDVFKFEIEDQGTSDGLSTLVTKITILPKSTNTADWTDHIQGIVLKKGASEVTLDNVIITDNDIQIEIVSGDLEIADGTSSVMTLSVYLNQTNIVDDAVLSFLIDADNHGFDEDPTGSRFSSSFLLGDIESNDITISVDATEIQFVQQPTNTNLGDLISPAVTVAFTDVNGNRDLLLMGETISITANNATLTGSPVTANIDASGIATFSNLEITTEASNITLTAEDIFGWVSPPSVVSNVFAVVDAPSLFISEVADPSDVYQARFVELYNAGSSAIDFDNEVYYFSRQANAGTFESIQLKGLINAGQAYVLAQDSADFYSSFGFYPNLDFFYLSGNGDDGYFLYKEGDHTSGILIDSYGEKNVDGTGEAWEYTDTKAVRIGSVTDPSSTWDSTEWHIPESAEVEDMTPGVHGDNVSWQGTTDTDWNTKGNNWSGTYGYIPDASFNVTITSQINQPTISAEAATNNLTISSGVLTVEASQSLRVYGDLSNSSGTTGLVLKADATGPSSLLHSTNGIQATVESYFNDFGAGQWYLVSSPLTDGVAGVFMDQYLDYWDETSAVWESIEDPNTPLVPGQGYSLLKDITNKATYSGTLNNGDVTISGLTKTTDGSYFDAGWNLVGNPYPSVLDVSKLDFGDQIIAAASVWPHGSTGPYLSWSQGGGGSIEARYIQPGQGFMIQLSTTNQSLSFTNNARTHHALASFDKGNEVENAESLKVTITDASDRTDETYLSLREEASIGFDNYYDVHKLFGSSNYPHIFSYIDVLNDEKAAIQSIPYPEPWQEIHLGHRIGLSGNFTLKVEGIHNFAPDLEIYLVDKLNQEIFNLRSDSVFQFYIDITEQPQRFDLLFDLSTQLNSIGHNNCKVFFVDDQLIIDQHHSEEVYKDLVIYNLLGQAIKTQVIESDFEMISVDLPSSYYVIQLRSQNKYLNQKIFKN